MTCTKSIIIEVEAQKKSVQCFLNKLEEVAAAKTRATKTIVIEAEASLTYNIGKFVC